MRHGRSRLTPTGRTPCSSKNEDVPVEFSKAVFPANAGTQLPRRSNVEARVHQLDVSRGIAPDANATRHWAAPKTQACSSRCQWPRRKSPEPSPQRTLGPTLIFHPLRFSCRNACPLDPAAAARTSTPKRLSRSSRTRLGRDRTRHDPASAAKRLTSSAAAPHSSSAASGRTCASNAANTRPGSSAIGRCAECSNHTTRLDGASTRSSHAAAIGAGTV